MGQHRPRQRSSTKVQIAAALMATSGTRQRVNALLFAYHEQQSIDNRGERTTASQPPLSHCNFSEFAHATSVWIGNSVAFLLAVAVIIVWSFPARFSTSATLGNS